MTTLTHILTTLVGIEFLYIMYLETFATTSPRTARVFGMTREELSRPSVNLLFKNQGIYNGLIGIALLLSLYLLKSPEITTLLLALIILVALYGSYSTRKPTIYLKQGLPATLALLSLLV